MRGKRELSRPTTVIVTLVLVAGMSWQASRGTVLDRSLDHVGSTIRRVDRSLEIADAATAKNERWSVLHVVADSPQEARRQGIRLYQRAIDRLEGEGRRDDARTLRAHLALLLLDAGRSAEARREITTVARSSDGCGFCRAVGFLASSSTPSPEPALQSLDPLRPGWSETQLQIRLLEARGDRVEASRLRGAAEGSARARLLRMLAFVAAAAVLLYVGILSLIFEIRYPRWRPRIAAPPPVATWSSAQGIGVLVRSEFVGLVLTLLVSPLRCAGPTAIVCVWDSFFWFLPVLWLARRNLTDRSWSAFTSDFRLAPFGLGIGEISRAALGLLSIIWITGTALDPFFRWLGWDSELSDLFFDPWAMDTPLWVALSGVNAIVWAPIAEEFTFRALLYATLRRIARPSVAAVASAALFAGVHLYSFPAFCEVFFVGLVFALGFERYRSLLPVVVCHAVENLLFVGFNLVAYR